MFAQDINFLVNLVIFNIFLWVFFVLFIFLTSIEALDSGNHCHIYDHVGNQWKIKIAVFPCKQNSSKIYDICGIFFIELFLMFRFATNNCSWYSYGKLEINTIILYVKSEKTDEAHFNFSKNTVNLFLQTQKQQELIQLV